MKVLVEKNADAPGLSRASCIALGLMLSYGAASRRPRRTITTFADLAQIPAEEQDVVLTDEQRSRWSLRPYIDDMMSSADCRASSAALRIAPSEALSADAQPRA